MKLRKPNVKQRQFVQELLKPGVTQTDAYMQVYDQQDRKLAHASASNLVRTATVSQHITDVLADKYPEAASEATEVLRNYIRDPDLSPKDKMKAVELLSKFLGWKAPDKIHKVTAHVNVDRYKLPE